jgi:diguanylate cyclase (GGDEF)-like protein/PAS domain S-box-containing protein
LPDDGVAQQWWVGAALDEAIDPVLVARPETRGGEVVDLVVIYANPASVTWAESIGETIGVGTRLGAGPRFAGYVEVLASGRPLALDAAPVAATPVRHIDLRVTKVAGDLLLTWRDVTERLAAERLGADLERRFRLAFDAAPVGMAIADIAEGCPARFAQVNETFAAMLGYAPQEMVGRQCPEFTHPSDRELDEKLLARLAEGDLSPYRREKRMVRADGSDLWVAMSSAPAAVDGRPAYAIVHVEDISARKAAEVELAHRALFDPVTGLAGRTLLHDHLASIAAELRHTGGELAVLHLDLDHFKDINSTLGHAAGDDVLRQVAGRLEAAQPDAVAARLAGDEFVVVARVTDDLSAVRLAERLHATVVRPIRLAGTQVVVRPSIGVATSADPGLAVEDLLRDAGLAMQHAKERGSEPWALYDGELHGLASGRLAVEADLRSALENADFRLLYQPIIDLADDRVVSVEALLRMQHPVQGLLGPASFIEVAEDCELIVPIGGWVLDEATRALAGWQRRDPDMEVSVNVSPRQVRVLAVSDQVMAATAASGTSADHLMLEITERVLLDANDDVLAELRHVTAGGCGLGIDDFGTGYSSLAYLTRFPVTELKIDRTFVAGLGTRGRDTAVVEAIIGLADALGLTTVAEGVETEAQLDVLRELGCGRAQGYYLGRPTESQRIAELIG